MKREWRHALPSSSWGKANGGKIPSRKSSVHLLFKKKKKEKLTPKMLGTLGDQPTI